MFHSPTGYVYTVYLLFVYCIVKVYMYVTMYVCMHEYRCIFDAHIISSTLLNVGTAQTKLDGIT